MQPDEDDDAHENEPLTADCDKEYSDVECQPEAPAGPDAPVEVGQDYAPAEMDEAEGDEEDLPSDNDSQKEMVVAPEPDVMGAAIEEDLLVVEGIKDIEGIINRGVDWVPAHRDIAVTTSRTTSKPIAEEEDPYEAWVRSLRARAPERSQPIAHNFRSFSDVWAAFDELPKEEQDLAHFIDLLWHHTLYLRDDEGHGCDSHVLTNPWKLLPTYSGTSAFFDNMFTFPDKVFV